MESLTLTGLRSVHFKEEEEEEQGVESWPISSSTTNRKVNTKEAPRPKALNICPTLVAVFLSEGGNQLAETARQP